VRETAAARQTATARAHATAQARTQQTQVAVRRAAAPGETATAVAQATNQAVARANAQATSQAQQAADAQATTSAANVLDVSGSGIQKTQKFTTNGGEWQIRWHYDCSTFGQSGNFQVYLYDSSGMPNIVVNELNTSGSGTDYEHSGGTFYLEINSECDWHVQVVSP